MKKTFLFLIVAAIYITSAAFATGDLTITPPLTVTPPTTTGGLTTTGETTTTGTTTNLPGTTTPGETTTTTTGDPTVLPTTPPDPVPSPSPSPTIDPDPSPTETPSEHAPLTPVLFENAAPLAGSVQLGAHTGAPLLPTANNGEVTPPIPQGSEPTDPPPSNNAVVQGGAGVGVLINVQDQSGLNPINPGNVNTAIRIVLPPMYGTAVVTNAQGIDDPEGSYIFYTNSNVLKSDRIFYRSLDRTTFLRSVGEIKIILEENP